MEFFDIKAAPESTFTLKLHMWHSKTTKKEKFYFNKKCLRLQVLVLQRFSHNIAEISQNILNNFLAIKHVFPTLTMS